MHCAVAGLAASVLLGAVPVFAEPVWVGPTWSSDQVRSARDGAPEPTLSFDLHTETASAGAAPRIETSHVVLAPDFDEVSTGATHVVDDFFLHRMFSWSDGAKSFNILDGHALPAFRVMELANRRAMAAMQNRLATASGKPISPSDNDPYWREAELGVSDPLDTPLALHKTASGTDLVLGGDPVVRIEGKTAALTEAERKALTRYLALHLPLHPQARGALADAGLLPATLTLGVYQGFTKQTVTYAFSKPVRAPTGYPLPPGLGSNVEAALAPAGSSSAAGVHAAVQAINGHFGKPKPTPDEIIAAMRKAVASGKPLEVWLDYMEFLQQYGFELFGAKSAELQQTMVPLVKPVLTDPEVARLHAASDIASGMIHQPVDRQAAARYLAQAKALDALPFGTFRYVTFANLVGGSKDTGAWDKAIFDAMPSPLVANYWTHIAAYPRASNAYKDTGTTYLAGFDTPKAWMAFDLGRAVDPDWRSNAMKSVADYEAVLEANEPDFF